MDPIQGSQGAGRVPKPVAAGGTPKAAPTPAPAAAGDQVRLSGARPFDVAEGSIGLADAMGAQNALTLVITARGGDGGWGVSPAEKQAAQQQLQANLGRSAPLTDTQLRDLDHYLNSYAAVQATATPKADDGLIARKGKTVFREAIGVVDTAVVLGYSAGKWVGQQLPFDPVAKLSGGKFTSVDPNTSKASWHEAWVGVKGVWQGVFDEKR